MNKSIIEIFSSIEKRMKSGENVDCYGELEGQRIVDYRELNEIIIDLYDEGKFVDICKAYVRGIKGPGNYVSGTLDRISLDILKEEGKIH